MGYTYFELSIQILCFSGLDTLPVPYTPFDTCAIKQIIRLISLLCNFLLHIFEKYFIRSSKIFASFWTIYIYRKAQPKIEDRKQ